MFKCEFMDCKFETKYLGNLKQHEIRHKGVKSFICEYPGCESSFFIRSELTRHNQKHSDQSYSCDICNFKTLHKNSLTDHKKRVHEQEKNHPCAKCDKEFYSAHDLKKHTDGIHTKTTTYKCEKCNFSTYYKDNLVTHENTHNGEFQCEYCAFNSRTKKTLMVHVNKEHLDINPYKCSYKNCDYRTNTTKKLKIHFRIHSGEKPYKCTDCEYKSTTNTGLKMHVMWLHSKERPFKCTFPECVYETVTSSALKRHHNFMHSEKGQQRQKKSETRTYNALAKYFDLKREHFIDFKCIDSGNCCYIDYLFIKNGILFFIENDEYQHSSYMVSCEVSRMLKVHSSLLQEGNTMPIVFIRFNPDSFEIDGAKQKVDFKSRIKKLIETVDNVSEYKDLKDLNIIYLFYDEIESKSLVTLDPDYPEYLKDCIFKF